MIRWNDTKSKATFVKIAGGFKGKLEAYRQSLEGVEPQEEDFTAIDELVESMPDFCQAEGPAEVVAEKCRQDLTMLVDLLGTDALTPGQQAAMVVTLEDLLGEPSE